MRLPTIKAGGTLTVCLLVAWIAGCGGSPPAREGAKAGESRRAAARRHVPALEEAADRDATARPAGRDEGIDPSTANGGEEPAAEGAEPAPAGATPAEKEEAADAEPAPAPAPRRGAKAARAPGRSPTSADEALDDLRETERLRVEQAKYFTEQGDEAYDKLDYKEAMIQYRKALDANPALGDVREKWARCGLVLGVRSAEVIAVRGQFVEEDRVKKDQHLADARQGLKEAEDLLKDGDHQNAARKFQKVYEELLWFDFPVDISDLRTQAKDGIARAAEQKKLADKEQRTKLETEASKQLDKTLIDEQRVKDRQVQELVRRASDYIRLKDYEKAIDACNRILELKPDNRLAKFWLRDLRLQQNDQRVLASHLERAEQQKLLIEGIDRSATPELDAFKFPEDAEWNAVRRRQESLEVVSMDDPEWIRKIKNNLESVKVNFVFAGRPLKEVLPAMSDWTGVNIIADPAINTGELNIDLAAKDMRALDALNQILTMTGLSYTFKENALYITEKDKAKGEVKFAIYNVSDILNKIRGFTAPEIKLKTKEEQASGGTSSGVSSVSFTGGGADDAAPLDSGALIELIKEGTGGDEVWTEQSTIEFHKGQLLVNASKEVHGLIQNTLKNLREDADLFVVIEARFIDIRDDFLEDIGIDTRALGQVNNFGTPFGTRINNTSTGGNDLGFVKTGDPVNDVTLIMGQDRYAGRVQHIIDGFTGLVRGTSLGGGQGGIGGLTTQLTFLEPFQLNVIIRAVQEKQDVRQLTAPIITAHNGQRVYVSVITQRAYIADYELVSGGTGFSIIEVADPVVQTFQEGVILDVNPVITPDKKYVTLDVRPTFATLIGGVISTIHISLGSFTNVAMNVPIGVPQIALQQSFTSVTVPNGGSVLLGGFKSLLDKKFRSYIPILGDIPLIKNLFQRKAQILEKRSLVVLVTARIIDLRGDERLRYNDDK